MAQATPSNQNDIAEALNEAIKEGKKLTEYLLNDADYLDAAEGLSDGDTRQLDSKSRDSFLRAWSHYIETGNSDAAIGTIAEALAYLRVGSDKGEQDAYLAYRNVDTEIIPKGPNIALTLVQDKRHYLAIPKSDRGRYEIIYNVRDGIIVFGHIKRPTGKALEDLSTISPGAKRFMEPCDVIGAMFQRLHTLHNPSSGAAKTALAYAKQAVAKAVSEQSPLPTLPADTAGSWLPAAASANDGITEIMISSKMRGFLNYIIVFVNEDYQAYTIVKHCVEKEIMDLSRTWDTRETFVIGERSYYALLGSDIGQEVAWLLAKRKGDGLWGLGHKAISSISVFHGGWSLSMTTEEEGRYSTPVLVFEVVDASGELRAIQEGQEQA